jgi:predicted ester cyclase
MKNERNAAVIQGLYAAVNQRDFDYLNTLCDEGSECLDIPFNSTVVGETSVTAVWKNRLRIFPDATCEIKNLVAHDNLVIVQGIKKGTHRGIFTMYDEYVEPSGTGIEIGFCDIYYMNEGKIVKANSNFDVYALFDQIYGECVA